MATGLAPHVRPVQAPALGAQSPDTLKRLLPGTLLEGEYASGEAWSERFGTDGTSRYSDVSGSFDGRVTFRQPGVCFTYATDSDLTGGCFEVWQRGRRCFDFYADGTVASLADRRFGRGWTARGWMPGGREDCETDLIS